MPKTRRLSDLYVTGKAFTFNDGEDEPVTVYIRKLNPVDNETGLRRANSLRAKVLAARHDETSTEYQNAYSQVYDLGEVADLVTYLVAPDLIQKRVVREAELADEPEWKENSYLQGLKDAWVDGLDKRYAEDKDDPEAKRVFEILERFDEMVNERMSGEEEALKRSYEACDEEELRQKVLAQFLEMQADMAWMDEYRKCEVWLSVRDNSNRREKYFMSREEVDELSLKMISELQDAYRSLSVDITEGKDSQATDSSSPQPEQPNPQETDDSSGQQTAVA